MYHNSLTNNLAYGDQQRHAIFFNNCKMPSGNNRKAQFTKLYMGDGGSPAHTSLNGTAEVRREPLPNKV